MRTIVITVQDIDENGAYISSRISGKYEISNNEYFISLIKKAEKDLDKLIWQKELAKSDKPR